MGSIGGTEKTPLLHTPSLTPPDCGPPQGLGEATPTAAEAGADNNMAAETGAVSNRETAVGEETPQNAGGGDHDHGVARVLQLVAGPGTEGPEASAVRDGGPGGAKAQESCGAEPPARDRKAEVEKGDDATPAAGAAEEGAEKPVDPGPPNLGLQMRSLEAIQVDLNSVNAQADPALQQLERKFGQIRLYYLERRNYVIQSIPGFWVIALRNHPQLFEMITGDT